MRFTVIVCLIFCAEVRAGETWPAFRGAGKSEPALRNLPVHWSPNDGLAWKVSLPGYGQSSPVIWHDHVYVTSVEGADKSNCIVLCLSAVSGEVLWRNEFPATQNGPNNPMMSRAAPTPVADAEGITVFFESGDLLSLSHEGDIRWQRSLSKEYVSIKNHHGLGSSPAQTDDTVFLLVEHTGPSYLLAVNKRTGENRWKSDRKSCLSWTSPVVSKVGNRTVILVSSGGTLTCYDATTGKSSWSLDGLYSNDVPSPVLSDNIVFVTGGDNPLRPRKDASLKTNCCLKLIDSDSTPDYKVVWSDTKALAYHASPIIHQNLVYIVARNGILHCRDLMSGETQYTVRLENTCWATPIVAEELIYLFGKDGVTTVIKAGRIFDRVATNALWDDAAYLVRKAAAQLEPQNKVTLPPASPEVTKEMEAVLNEAIGDVVYGVAAIDSAFYVRTESGLYCIRNRAK